MSSTTITIWHVKAEHAEDGHLTLTVDGTSVNCGFVGKPLAAPKIERSVKYARQDVNAILVCTLSATATLVLYCDSVDVYTNGKTLQDLRARVCTMKSLPLNPPVVILRE